MGGKKRKGAAFLCFTVVLLLFLTISSQVVLPKRENYGAVWDMYLKEPKQSVDVLLFGSSVVYCNVIPAVIYEETGISSFVMAGPDQTLPVTLSYIKEAVKTQDPSVIFVEISALFYPRENDSVKVNLCYMPWGWNRVEASWSQTTGEERLGLFFPLYAYHDRWKELTAKDFLPAQPDPFAGYTFLSGEKQQAAVQGITLETTEEVFQQNVLTLQEIDDFCKEREIRCVFYLSPGAQRLEGELKTKVEAFFVQCSGEFWDLSQEDQWQLLSLNVEKDFFDQRHFNWHGAEKFSLWLGEELSNQILPENQEDAALWQQRIEVYQKAKEENP